MTFDPEDRELFFNEEMILTEEGSSECLTHYKKWQLARYGGFNKNSGKLMVGGAGKINGTTLAGLVASVAVIIGTVATSLCILLRHFVFIPWILCALLMFIGVVTVVFTPQSVGKTFSEGVLFRRIEGGFAILGALGMILVSNCVSIDEEMRFLSVVLFDLFTTISLVMGIKTIGYLSAPRNIYIEEIKAKCIGYVRSYEVNKGSESEGQDIGSLSPVISPVYEYKYKGVNYTSYSDQLQYGKDGRIPVGSECMIRIDPDEPSHVLGSIAGYAVMPLCCTIISTTLVIALIVIIMS